MVNPYIDSLNLSLPCVTRGARAEEAVIASDKVGEPEPEGRVEVMGQLITLSLAPFLARAVVPSRCVRVIPALIGARMRLTAPLSLTCERTFPYECLPIHKPNNTVLFVLSPFLFVDQEMYLLRSRPGKVGYNFLSFSFVTCEQINSSVLTRIEWEHRYDI